MISLPLDEYPIVCAFWMPKSSRVPIGTYGLRFCCWLNVLRSNQRSSEGLQWNTCVPMGPAVFFFCFLIFSRFLPLLGQDPNKNLQKTNEKKHSNVSALVPAGLEVFFLHPHFFATFGRRQNESLRASLAEIDRYLHLFVSEMLAFRIQFHCKVVLHIFSLKQLDAVKWRRYQMAWLIGQQIEANSLTWWSTAHPSKMAKKMASLETILVGCTTIGQRWRMTCLRIGDSQSTEDFSCSYMQSPYHGFYLSYFLHDAAND